MVFDITQKFIVFDNNKINEKKSVYSNTKIVLIVFVDMSKMIHFIALDDDAPPAKRLKLQSGDAENRDLNNNIENDKGQEFGLPSPTSDVRKRKIAVKRPVESKSILELNAYAMLEILDYLPLNG